MNELTAKQEPLVQTIEQVGLKEGQKIFVEFKLEAGGWPSDDKVSFAKTLMKETHRTKGS